MRPYGVNSTLVPLWLFYNDLLAFTVLKRANLATRISAVVNYCLKYSAFVRFARQSRILRKEQEIVCQLLVYGESKGALSEKQANFTKILVLHGPLHKVTLAECAQCQVNNYNQF